MNHFIQPNIPLITGDCVYEFSIPKKRDIEDFWYQFHKKLLLKYGEINQRKYSCLIEKEIRILLDNDQIDFFIALSYFIEKLRFYKKENYPPTINFWILVGNDFSITTDRQSYLKIPYQATFIDKKLVPNLASYLFGLKRENEFLNSCPIAFPQNLKSILTTLIENKFPRKLEYKDILNIKKLNLTSIKGYQQYKDPSFKKITLVKMYKKLTKNQKRKANAFLTTYKEKKIARLCL